MNPRLDRLNPYPFEKLRALLGGIEPPAGLAPISLGIGEPQHPTPALIKDALAANVQGLARYPMTLGLRELRTAIAQWLARRYGLASIDADHEVLPVLGTREALFSIGQTLIDPDERGAVVMLPNPGYQIYEGAAILGGAKPHYVNAHAARGFASDWDAIPAETWRATRLVYTCSPHNPTGRVMPLAEWKRLFELSDKYGFVLVSDECYSEIYFDEGARPLGALRAAKELGREGFPRLVVMGSLSKRSNAPGLRSGFAAGDRALLARFVLYRMYHGSQMSNTVQMASIAAWNDEAHVVENRRLYREKFATFYEKVNPVLPLTMPEAGFYFWADVGRACPGNPEAGDDAAFAAALFAATGVTVLPGSFVGREADGVNPGRGYVRMALVSTLADANEAATRIAAFARSLEPSLSASRG
ncbi:MAG: succinyldiaminopimelate transaminase [Usitatibacter sp.]